MLVFHVFLGDGNLTGKFELVFDDDEENEENASIEEADLVVRIFVVGVVVVGVVVVVVVVVVVAVCCNEKIPRESLEFSSLATRTGGCFARSNEQRLNTEQNNRRKTAGKNEKSKHRQH